MIRKSPKFSPEVQERAVRMVFDAKQQYPSQWAAIESIAGKIGCTGETLRKWVRQGERDSGVRPGSTTVEQQRIKELEREVRELRKTNEILKLASAHFAQAELDRHHSPRHADQSGAHRCNRCCCVPSEPVVGLEGWRSASDASQAAQCQTLVENSNGSVRRRVAGH